MSKFIFSGVRLVMQVRVRQKFVVEVVSHGMLVEGVWVEIRITERSSVGGFRSRK